MSTTMQPVLHSFAYALDYLRDQVAELSAGDLVAQPGVIRNHPAWTIGHLTFVCQLLGGAIGLEPWLPDDWSRQFGPGSLPVAETSRYPSKDELLHTLTDAQQRMARAVERLSAAELDAVFPVPEYREVFPTIRHALTQVLVGHASYHVGQVSLWRKMMGLTAAPPPDGRAFE